MLVQLDIRNIVLIDHLALDIAGGLSVLTGETGAGKSILLDALGLLRGDRADMGLIRAGCDQAVVSATFDIPKQHAVLKILHDQGLMIDDDTLVLRRVLSSDGKSRAFINDQSVTLGTLRTVGHMLVDLHGQFETSDLLDPAHHRDLIDIYGNHHDLCGAVVTAWQTLHTARKNYADAQENAAIAARDQDYLRDAVQKLSALDPKVGEETDLVERKTMLAARAQILEGLAQVGEHLSGDNGAEQKLIQASRILERLRTKLPEHLMTSLNELDEALSTVRDIAATFDDQATALAGDDNDLESIDDRLYELRAQARRYSCTVDDLPEKLASMQQQLQMIDGGADIIMKLAADVKRAETTYQDKAVTLSRARVQAAKKLDTALKSELSPLKLDKARFITVISPLPLDRYGPSGTDSVAFHVATNPGTEPGPLEKIASGGEMSRIMLALKVVTAQQQNNHVCMIFDEVDSGLGGAVAAAVAERLARLAKNSQVLVVTHAPQVAARADHHFIVSKSSKGKTTLTQVLALSSANDRREEIARMLSGEKITDEARAAAARLLQERAA
jgi:DNA repair protein RecN (Recombination protein N)